MDFNNVYLPPEIILSIATILVDDLPSLDSLSRTSRLARTWAVQILYRSVGIYISNPDWKLTKTAERSFISCRNPNTKYITEIRLLRPTIYHVESDWSEKFNIHSFLNALKRDQLKSLISAVPATQKVWTALRRQKKLSKVLWSFSMCSADLANDIYNRYLSSKGRLRLPKNQLTGEPLFFSEVTVTGITNSRDAAYINSWVSSLRGLKKIRMSFHNHISYFIDDHGHYLPGIWKTMIPISKTTNRISTLKLNNVDIKGLAGSLAVELVTTLKLHRCTGLDEFFSAWMLRNPRISLKKLWLYIDGKISRDDALSTSQQIDLFISSSLGLRELVLCSNVHKKYPLWVAARHQKTLQYLLLEVLHAKGTTRCMTQDEIQRLSNDLDGYPEIRELGLPVEVNPKTSVRAMKRISNLARKVDYFQLQKPSALFANHPINRLGVWRIADRIYGAGCKTPPKLKVISQVTGIHHNTWVLGGKEPLSRPAIVYFITPGTPPILKEANLEEMEKKSKLIKGAGRWPWV